MCIRHRELDQEADEAVSSLCTNITSLDIGGNLFESWHEIMHICNLFPRLNSLTLDGNRLHNLQSIDADSRYLNIRYLGLTDTLLKADEIATVTKSSPSLQTLILANNELEAWESTSSTSNLPPTVHSLDLSGNQITTLTSLQSLLTLPNLHTLLLKANKIGSSPQTPTSPTAIPTTLSRTLLTLDLRSNDISTWLLPSTLLHLFPSLTNLLIATNPLYITLTTFDAKPLTPSDGYTLTLARLPQLQTLNHSTVTDKERLNAETYYLGQIARELAQTPSSQRAEILAAHPRWTALCEEYGEPAISVPRGEGEVDPSSLAARLVTVTFYLAAATKAALSKQLQHDGGDEWTAEIPRSASVYALLGRVGKRLDISPLKVQLAWETGERDPVRKGGEGGEAPEEWDSSDEEDEGGEGEWVAREVRLVAGTRMVGSYLEGREARVRVEGL